MGPAEKISTIPMMTEANQPQLSRPIMHMKPVPMTASVATVLLTLVVLLFVSPAARPGVGGSFMTLGVRARSHSRALL